MNISFHPSVFGEIDAIMRYYESVSGQQLADDFYTEFRNLIRQVGVNPEVYNERKGKYRRVNLERFPYNFLFRIQESSIRILVVRHHGKRPSFGIHRK